MRRTRITVSQEGISFDAYVLKRGGKFIATDYLAWEKAFSTLEGAKRYAREKTLQELRAYIPEHRAMVNSPAFANFNPNIR